MKILFVTRKFPPVIGGMENVASKLYDELSARTDVRLIASRSKAGGKSIGLPFVYLSLFIRAFRAGKKLNPDIIYVQDGVLAPLGRMLRFCLRRPVVVTIHGTEVVYGNRLYKKLVLPSLGKMDQAVVISDGTAEKTRLVLPKLPITKVIWGSDDDFFIDQPKADLKALLSQEINLDLKGKAVLYHSGRLIERKGAFWFVDNVMPELVKVLPEAILLIGGGGEDAEAIADVIEQKSLESNVKLLGYVRGELRNLLYNSADMFVMPNIPGYGFEGFGMVAVEASSCGTPVVASRFEGITDAVIEGKTGWFAETKNVDSYIARIESEIKHPTLKRDGVRRATIQKYNWKATTEGYLRVFKEVSTNFNG